MDMDVISIKIKVINESLTVNEKAELIIEQLRSLADHVESVGGNVQRLKDINDDSIVEYNHLKNT